MQIGDTVWLKSGGPAMTVIELKDGVVAVEWFDGNDELCGGEFKAAVLDTEEPK